MKTIFITGASSGFGLETSKYFLERGWKVIATMRSVREDVLPRNENLRILSLDVTNAESIRKAVAAAGPVDVLVNNAGIGAINALEGMSMESIRDIFETNTFGTMAMMQAFMPQFRERKAGVIVNVTSSATLKSIPLFSVYTASKTAVEAFTASVAIELQQFNVRVGLVIPGAAPKTEFAKNVFARNAAIPEPYKELFDGLIKGLMEDNGPKTEARDVAEAIWKTVNEPNTPMKLPAGPDAISWLEEAKRQAQL